MTTTPGAGAPVRRTYRPGDWFGIVGERVVVALPPTEKARVAALWELVDGGAGFDVTLDALIAGGLRDLPGFVLVSTIEGETRLVLRGEARAVLATDDDRVVVEGSAATTWVERTLTGVVRMGLELAAVPDDGTDDGSGPSYVVDGGLFRLGRFEEAPAHEGPDEGLAEPAYEREFPLEPEEPQDEVPASPVDVDTEPDPEPLAPPRSPVPPAWTPAPPPLDAPVAPPGIPPAVPAGGPVSSPAAGPVPPVPSPLPTDHDGLTVTGPMPAPPVPPGIPGQPPAPDVTRPVARLELSDGEVIDVDRAIVFGRDPQPRRYSPTEQPRAVRVHSPRLEVSSTHLEVRPGTGADHGSAVATDLGSTNGTVLVQAGLGPRDLVAGEAVQLLPGALLDLGDGVQIRVTSAPR